MRKPPGIMIYVEEYSSFRSILSDEQKGILLDALIDYQSDKEPDIGGDPLLKAALNILSIKIKRDEEKYSEMCERNASIARNRKRQSGRDVKPPVTSRDESLPVNTNSNSNSNSNSNCNSNSKFIEDS